MDLRRLTSMADPSVRAAGGNAAFREFNATELYCPRCRRAVPVRQRLLLVLPDGDQYEYRCTVCAESLGTKLDRSANTGSVLV